MIRLGNVEFGWGVGPDLIDGNEMPTLIAFDLVLSHKYHLRHSSFYARDLVSTWFSPSISPYIE